MLASSRRPGGLARLVPAALCLWACLPREPVGDVGEPDLATVQSRIFTSRCATADCHGGTMPRSGMNLTAGLAVSSLVGILAEEARTLYRVLPGDADNSYLIHKLRGTQGEVGGSGERMPLGGAPLSEAEIALVAAWIDGLTIPLPAPTIASITPPSASAGAVVQIAGQNFGPVQGGGVVTFGGVDASAGVTSWSAIAIEVAVPEELAPGAADVVVEVEGQASAAFPFEVSEDAPSIYSVGPNAQVVGATVEVRGSNLGAARDGSVVRFGTVAVVDYVAWAADSVQVVVPIGATSDGVTVTVDEVTTNSLLFFVV